MPLEITPEATSGAAGGVVVAALWKLGENIIQYLRRSKDDEDKQQMMQAIANLAASQNEMTKTMERIDNQVEKLTDLVVRTAILENRVQTNESNISKIRQDTQ